ncbi:cell division protein FtsL [Enterococcus malodoratus]|uniref:Cell division protein FtsL n=1 Tax=Enterococcus malodoratus ATCC 43197 TaxID=1158601 RepID=R2P416_9ENTE|nr:cell division protein FtsL [Enterococcus malodoratus]EOH78997.1 cell division protein FtsL [Enterococcus malodoratus ATCC 43197]EOT64578.1 cell division protein FtsL [Enterococcus malodoratus ATCC 43197]OJG65622.1 cell division protein FtsL [Enterococcus malodoratus]SPW92623.1 cell division protein [Enterococcus malodoratus]STC72712.1 cell division protein [Enterococcus malodoratus]
MAELKNNQQLQFDSQQEEIHQTPDSFKVFVSPGDRLKKITRVEKFAVLAFLVMLVGLSIVMVNYRNEISKTQNEITSIQTDIDAKEKTATQLQQEKSELSRSDRLKEVAEKAGLSINDANLRKVK